jgi:type II secretory pathway pseudopilin PulG
MIRSTPGLRARSGFTLVELLVSAALIVFIMAILAACFQLATDSMREIKAVGDLASRLRAAEIVLRRDLAADHFQPQPGNRNGGVHVSDQTLDQLVVVGTTGSYRLTGWRPPRAGFFRVKSTPSIGEGNDADGLTSTRATDHYLHFTSILPDTVDMQPYTATVPVGGQSYKSRAAELAYFLDPIPTGNTGGLSLHKLIRRQRLAALSQGYVTDLQPAATAGDRAVVSTRPVGVNLVVNTLADLTDPNNRLGHNAAVNPNPTPTSDGDFAALLTRPGDDVLLTNVISFEVRVTWTSAVETPPATPPAPKLPFVRFPTGFQLNVSTDYPFDSLPAVPATASPVAVGTDPAHTVGNTLLAGQHVYDSWYTLPSVDANTGQVATADLPRLPPLLIRVQAVQLRIRVWDPNTQSTRQITIVQEL